MVLNGFDTDSDAEYEVAAVNTSPSTTCAHPMTVEVDELVGSTWSTHSSST